MGPASSWTALPDEGFFHPNYRNAALSYFIGLDVFPNDRVGLIAGDRNLRFNLGGGSCSSGITYNGSLACTPFANPGIGSGLHVEAGNFLFLDGSVEELSSEGFNKRWAALWLGEDAAEAHYLQPN